MKFITIILAVFCASILAFSCGSRQQEDQHIFEKKDMNRKILIAYFSHSGNTKTIAEMISKSTSGELFEIIPVKDYPTDYKSVTDQAKMEINFDFRPELKSKVSNIDAYDIIFVGSPNWWGTVAPPVATFLESYDLKGKTIVPFITHEGSGLGRCVSDIKAMCPNSNLLPGLAVRGGSVGSASDDVNKWLRSIKIIG